MIMKYNKKKVLNHKNLINIFVKFVESLLNAYTYTTYNIKTKLLLIFTL